MSELVPVDAPGIGMPIMKNRSSEELRMRDIVVEQLRKKYPDARVIHELPTRYGSRIDLAAITPTQLVTVEIKSSRDVADRLERQIRDFAPISTSLILALAPKWNEELPYIEKARKDGGQMWLKAYTEAQNIIRKNADHHIETWTVCADAGSAKRTDGGYAVNKTPWSGRLLDILHNAELEEIASKHAIPLGRSRTHKVMVDALAHYLPGRHVMTSVCCALRAREAFARGSDAPIKD